MVFLARGFGSESESESEEEMTYVRIAIAKRCCPAVAADTEMVGLAAGRGRERKS